MAVSVVEEATFVKGCFTIANPGGLHARPSTTLVRCATAYPKANITLSYLNSESNAKSLLSVMVLGAPRGSKIGITAVGPGADKAVEQILALSEVQFNMKY